MTHKRRILLAIIVTFVTFFHLKADEKQQPFTFEASYIGDAVANMHGGLKTGITYLGMGNINVSFDTEAAHLWRGGRLHLNGASIHGNSPTDELVGDFQTVDNIDGGNHSYMHEIWYRHSFATFAITVGLQDLNADFAVTENGSAYINGSFGISSLISNNVPAPVFPLTALGVSWKWNVTPKFTWLGAVFDGQPTDFEDDNKYNLNWHLNKNDCALFFSEFQFSNLVEDTNGSYKIGGYYHLRPKSVTGESPEVVTFDGNYGLYVLADQDVKRWDNGKKLSAFAQVSISPKKKNIHNFYVGGGANFYAPFGRANDIAGLAFAHAGFHTGTHKHETTIEAFYHIRLTENIALQPDLQYVIKPAGNETNLKNAMVAILRCKLAF